MYESLSDSELERKLELALRLQANERKVDNLPLWAKIIDGILNTINERSDRAGN